MNATFHRTLLLAGALLIASSIAAAAQTNTAWLDHLREGSTHDGFRAEAVYLNDAGQPMGGRFVHIATGFTLDLLEIQSVPQAFIWVNTPPTSDRGEPHTQEHLLLGKGNRGRSVAALQGMSLATSSAFTQQLQTCYHFSTAGGADTFFKLLGAQLDALLHPDYTDEEIRREVRNFGVTQDADSTLRLEEKGTVYNEMVSTFERPWSRLFRTLNYELFGHDHPESYSSGGFPDSIATMTPENIRSYHRAHYNLPNMGMVVAFSSDIPIERILVRTDSILSHLQTPSEIAAAHVYRRDSLPAPHPQSPGTIAIARYPQKNAEQPGTVLFAWPADLRLDSREMLLGGLMLDNIAGDATTPLYKRFIDTRTRTMDIGAKSVFSWIDSDPGNTVVIGFGDVPPAQMSDDTLGRIRQAIVGEIRHIASLEPGSTELEAFNDGVRSRLRESWRQMSKSVGSPPGFGTRGTGSWWADHLRELARTGGFRRSLTQRGDYEAITKMLDDTRKNPWAAVIMRLKLLEDVPYVAAVRPDPALVEQDEQARQSRIDAEVHKLELHYGVDDPQKAIAMYSADYDRATARIDSMSAAVVTPPFMHNPPLTLDDQLDYRQSTLAGTIPMVASRFDNMTGATLGLALRLDGVGDDDLVYVSMLPELMTSVGVIEDGKTVSYEQMADRLRDEILDLSARYSVDYTTGRIELAVTGSGNDLDETRRAIEWMNLVLHSPDWRVDNLSRIRDVVDQRLAALRKTMQGSEESWVQNPAAAYRRQNDGLMLAAESFLTREHLVQRLRWLLRDAGGAEERTAVDDVLTRLGQIDSIGSRKELVAMLQAVSKGVVRWFDVPERWRAIVERSSDMPGKSGMLVREAANDVLAELAGVPDETLEEDYHYLVGEIRSDLLVDPAVALEQMTKLRESLLEKSRARMYIVGSGTNEQTLAPDVAKLASALGDAPAPDSRHVSDVGLIDARLREHAPDAGTIRYVGLINPNTQSGVFLNSAPLSSYADTSRDALMNYLAAQLYGGYGPHGLFMKTWGAGLAYSNGIGANLSSGRISYYAERCPELPQTMAFVCNQLAGAKPEAQLADYVIAQAFTYYRSDDPYEQRGAAIAADLADHTGPQTVARFRRAVLALRDEPNLVDELSARMPSVYGRVLPGYGVSTRSQHGSVFMVIGPDKQMELYESYLKRVEGDGARLYRMYPRDFWITAASEQIGLGG